MGKGGSIMKNLKKVLFKCANAVCMLGLFAAIHGINITCTGKYYQPAAPKALDAYKKF